MRVSTFVASLTDQKKAKLWLTFGMASFGMTLPTSPALAAAISDSNASLNFQSADLQVAQTNTCRQVADAIGGLRVREEPDIAAAVVGLVPNGRNVTIQSLGSQGWVPITAPLEGFVSASYLTGCDLAIAPPEASPPGANPDTPEDRGMCRTVSARGGLNVREEPTLSADRSGWLPDGRSILIENLGTNGWVPITEPIDGYVSATYLSYCS